MNVIYGLCLMLMFGKHAGHGLLPGDAGNNTKDDVTKSPICTRCKPGETLSQYMWRITADTRHAVMETPVILGLSTGTLDPNVFSRLVLQDAIWCEETGELIAMATDRMVFDHDVHLHTYLFKTAADYISYAGSLYGDAHMVNGSGIKLTAGTRAYLQYERHVAETMNAGALITCLLPCAKLWPWIGSQIITDKDTFGVYSNWVRYMFDPAYDGYRALEAYIDDMNARGLLDETTAIEVFTNSLKGELDFFAYV